MAHPLRLLVFVFLVVHVSHVSPLPLSTYDDSMCSESFSCGGVEIRYPFYLSNATRAAPDYASNYSCGYNDLKIFCEGEGKAIAPLLHLHGDTYTILNISYDDRHMVLADTDVLRGNLCPRVSHNVSLGQAWLSYTDSLDNLTFFFDCYNPGDQSPPDLPDYQINCKGFSGDGVSFVFTSEKVDVSQEYDLAGHCNHTFEVPVHKDPLLGSGLLKLPTAYGAVLQRGFELEWNPGTEQVCNLCEQSAGGRCAYSESKQFLGCLCPGGKVGVQDCNGATPASAYPTPRSKGKGKAAIGGVVAGAAGLFLVAAGIVFFLIRRRKQRKVVNSSSKLLKYSGSGGTPTRSRDGFDLESGSVQGMGSRFSYEELEEATDSFNENRELGDGGFGTVYKGYLEDGRVVAVKKLYNNSYRRVEQFVNEAAILARLRHPNLVMFYGCTSKESRDLLLVYEFVQNGTVADHLHGHRAQERALPWPLRLNIAIESAAALTYLHAIEPPIIHRDVKTNNILLDGDFHVKVADFGLSRLFPLDVTHVSTAPQGTPGYVDPEYHQCYQLTDKSDVYSFGVVLVELISSKPAVDITRQRNEINLAGMAINRIQKCQLEELVDLQLGYESDPATKKMMTMVAELAFRCLQQNGEMRPPIKEVHDVLRAIKDGSVAENGGVGKDKDLEPPFSPNTVHAPWDSRSTTPNTSQ
ncbi:LEAF RUST 10 DISEASE-RESISTANCEUS RECEPTOR-LIKE PROTEIN KINASE-like 1.2 isoform X2 [Lolium perenne]|uniref:LEAF RUST 10 DISEASE-RESISTANCEUS RECEPTOR-LIKE PROTEIN KINASE-like 1.2 isoform X2 n=1 Tax=Lolium perenne TaxID=4522 RepID=UPI0021F63456|nr:LEAF RUST 10 DISEASE-RESISTANCE LOCUS RECEPTOR-LIKE PROTEIN KINASE-like 1.2 isoform X2 [Lolium perenne]